MVRAQWRAMEEFYRAGKAKAIGVSNYCPSCFACLSSASVFPMVNQVQYHVGMGLDPSGLMSFAKEHGVVVQAYSVLNLTTTIAKAHDKSSVQVALKWVVESGIPAVTKSSKTRHLEEDLDLWSWSFSPDERAALDAHSKPSGHPSFACSSTQAASSADFFLGAPMYI